MMNSFNEKLKNILYPLTTFVILLIVWQVSITVFEVPNYILPDLRDVGAALWRGYVDGAYWRHFFFTMQAMLIGYAIGSVRGAVGLVGPTRMNYPRMVALVDQISKRLTGAG